MVTKIRIKKFFFSDQRNPCPIPISEDENDISDDSMDNDAINEHNHDNDLNIDVEDENLSDAQSNKDSIHRNGKL